MDKMQIENLKELYPVHTKIRLIHMRDKYAPPAGTIGYVTGMDDMGTIHVNWKNGSSLGLVDGIDLFEVLSRPYTAMAHIHSLKGEMDEITIIEKVGDNDYIVDYKGVKCHALFNWFVCQFYADDIYRIVKEDEYNG